MTEVLNIRDLQSIFDAKDRIFSVYYEIRDEVVEVHLETSGTDISRYRLYKDEATGIFLLRVDKQTRSGMGMYPSLETENSTVASEYSEANAREYLIGRILRDSGDQINNPELEAVLSTTLAL